MSKYDGDLIRSLMWAVGRIMAPALPAELSDASTGLLDGKAACCERLSDGRHVFPCIHREQPTDMERADAWAQEHTFSDDELA